MMMLAQDEGYGGMLWLIAMLVISFVSWLVGKLKEMSGKPLLTKEQEVSVAMKIEAMRSELYAEVFSSPLAMGRLVEISREVRAGTAQMQGLVVNYEEYHDVDTEALCKEFHGNVQVREDAMHGAIKGLASTGTGFAHDPG